MTPRSVSAAIICQRLAAEMPRKADRLGSGPSAIAVVIAGPRLADDDAGARAKHGDISLYLQTQSSRSACSWSIEGHLPAERDAVELAEHQSCESARRYRGLQALGRNAHEQ
jgi:hypothetical protein